MDFENISEMIDKIQLSKDICQFIQKKNLSSKEVSYIIQIDLDKVGDLGIYLFANHNSSELRDISEKFYLYSTDVQGVA